jgi:heme exporter protein A
MLTLNNLSLFKDNKKIFTNLGLSISLSSALVIRGQNGCGKSSLLKIIAQISQPSAGEILWGGVNVKNFLSDFTGDLQYLGHKNFLKPQLTILENLEFFARLAGTENALSSAINFFELEEFATTKISKLSAGLQKRVQLAKLLACPATIWVLDEPSINLDKKWRQKFHDLIAQRIKEDALVILATHDEMFFDLGVSLNLENYN